MFNYVVCLCRGVMDDVFSVCIMTRGALGAHVWKECSSFRCCMFVSCVHPVSVLNVLNAEVCMTCSLLMLVEDARGDHIKEAYSRASLIGSDECLLLFTPSCCECFYH